MSQEQKDNEDDTIQEGWVTFEDEKNSKQSGNGASSSVQSSADQDPHEKDIEYNGAVIEAETVQVSVPKQLESGVSHDKSSEKPKHGPQHDLNLQDIPLDNHNHQADGHGGSEASKHPSRDSHGSFANGDVIVTLVPLNTRWAWITPAAFRPDLVPEELMAQGLTLTVEEYVHAMEILLNDFRFTLYNILYKRILVAWITTGFIILLCVLFSGLRQLELFGVGILWLILNASAIFFCMWIKVKLNRNMERCVASVNKLFIRHNIILGIDDRGKFSCHKVNICYIYFDVRDCLKKLKEVIAREEASGNVVNSEEKKGKKDQRSINQRMDIEDQDVVITGSSNRRISRKQDKAERLLLRYSQRWAKDFLRKRLDWIVDVQGRLEGIVRANQPRHMVSAQCPCQYIEDHLHYKPLKEKQNSLKSWWHGWMSEGALD